MIKIIWLVVVVGRVLRGIGEDGVNEREKERRMKRRDVKKTFDEDKREVSERE